jgi:hypothetical protein
MLWLSRSTAVAVHVQADNPVPESDFSLIVRHPELVRHPKLSFGHVIDALSHTKSAARTIVKRLRVAAL